MANVPRLLIMLPDDRSKPGRIAAMGTDNKPIAAWDCLGQATGDPKQNPKADPVKYRGHTPIGPYSATHMRRLEVYTPEYGQWKITLDPDEVTDPRSQAAKAEKNGRTGILIHGGRNQTKLSKTYGCVRMFDRDLDALAKIVGSQKFRVDIVRKS